MAGQSLQSYTERMRNRLDIGSKDPEKEKSITNRTMIVGIA